MSDTVMVRRFPMPEVNGVNTYLVWLEESRQAFIIDPGGIADNIPAFIQETGLDVRGILLTHTHWDHIGGVSFFRDRFEVDVFAHAEAPDSRRLANRFVKETEVLSLGDVEGRIWETFGHQIGHVCYQFGEHLFSGDALYAGSVGGTIHAAQFVNQVEAIRRKLFTLGDNVRVWPGHGPATRIGLERRLNPFFLV